MNNELQTIADTFMQLPDICVSQRGKGKSTFLYICSPKKSVEASIDASQIWVEYWDDADTESDQSPAREELFNESEDAINSIVNWLGD